MAFNTPTFRQVPFSPDQPGFRGTEAATPAQAILDSIRHPGDIHNYISEVHVGYQQDLTYILLDTVRRDIDESYGKLERFGEAFLDGAAVELDIITRFAPEIQANLHQSVLTHLNKLSLAHYIHDETAHFITDAQQRNFVEAVMSGRHRKESVLLPDELDLMHTIHVTKYTEGSHLMALTEGYNFVRAHAIKAYERDYSGLSKRALANFKGMSDHDFDRSVQALIDAET